MKKRKIKHGWTIWDLKKIHYHPLRNVSMIFCSWAWPECQGFEFFWFALVKPEKGRKGNTESTRSIIPLFQFHTLYKAEFKALSTSIIIIKAIYTKKKKNTPIYRNTQPAISPWFCVLYMLKLFNLPTVFFFILQHCKGGHLVQLLTATDYQWCEKDLLDILVAVEFSCLNMAHSAQSRGQKQKNKQKKKPQGSQQQRVVLLWELTGGESTGGTACTTLIPLNASWPKIQRLRWQSGQKQCRRNRNW